MAGRNSTPRGSQLTETMHYYLQLLTLLTRICLCLSFEQLLILEY